KKSRRVLMLRDPTIGAGSGMLGAIQGVAPSFGVELTPIDYRDAITLTRYVETFSRRPNGGLIVVPNPNATVHLDLMVGLAAKYRLPTIYPYRYFPESGGLISYGIDNLDLWRRAAGYVDRVLKGEKPSDLPVQEPTKFELVINLKTARTLGLNTPTTLLATADKVIE